MSPKVTQNRTQNEVRKVSKMENANCEQNKLFTMFQEHFALAKASQNLHNFLQNASPHSLHLFGLPEMTPEAFGVRPVAHFGSSWSPPWPPKALPRVT